MAEYELPRAIALAWGVAEQPVRGPKREMSIERIVEVAIELADADGLGAVSMSSVAGRLGYTTMSLYRYVSAKDDLLVLMTEEGVGPPPDTDPVDGPSASTGGVGLRGGQVRWVRRTRSIPGCWTFRSTVCP